MSWLRTIIISVMEFTIIRYKPAIISHEFVIHGLVDMFARAIINGDIYDPKVEHRGITCQSEWAVCAQQLIKSRQHVRGRIRVRMRHVPHSLQLSIWNAYM